MTWTAITHCLRLPNGIFILVGWVGTLWTWISIRENIFRNVGFFSDPLFLLPVYVAEWSFGIYDFVALKIVMPYLGMWRPVVLSWFSGTRSGLCCPGPSVVALVKEDPLSV